MVSEARLLTATHAEGRAKLASAVAAFKSVHPRLVVRRLHFIFLLQNRGEQSVALNRTARLAKQLTCDRGGLARVLDFSLRLNLDSSDWRHSGRSHLGLGLGYVLKHRREDRS